MDSIDGFAFLGVFNAKLFAAMVVVCFGLIFMTTEDTPHQAFWKSHPLPGTGKGLLRWLRATIKSLSNTKAIVDDGYNEYSRKGATFTIPSFDMGGFVVVPPTQLKRLYGLPETKLDTLSSQLTVIQAQYTIEDLDILHNPFHAKILGAQLPKALEELTPGMAKQAALGLEKAWGVSKDWRQVPLSSSIASVVARSMNLVYVGDPLCAMPMFMDPMQAHGAFVFTSGFLINTLPKILRPVLGYFVALYGRRIRAKCMRFLQPVVEERMKKYNEHHFSTENPVLQQDAISWAIEDSFKMEDTKKRDAYQIAHRILLLNFASIHTTGLVAANMILDLYCTDPSAGIIEDLREEIADALSFTRGHWTKEMVSRLNLLDLAIIESMRLSPTSILGLPRTITDSEGAKLHKGTHIPAGISIVTPVEAIHLDPNLYAKPLEYHPFRSGTKAKLAGKRCQVTEEVLRSETCIKMGGPESEADYRFTGFGFGRHACPGRAFAMHELKITIAHILHFYDIEFMTEKPEKFRALWIQTPLKSTHIKIRRRITE